MTPDTYERIDIRNRVAALVAREQTNQFLKWGEQNHNDFYWYGILAEEFGEVGKALIETTLRSVSPYPDIPGIVHMNIQSPDISEIKKEVIHVAAVAMSWLEAMERRLNKPEKVRHENQSNDVFTSMEK